MTRITSVALRRVLDSRENPTVKADMLTESGGFGRAAAPSGASIDEYETIEPPPTEAIAAAWRHAIPRLMDEIHTDNRHEIDATLHATGSSENFSKIGTNSTVAISMTTAKVGADVLGVSLYQCLGGAFRGDNFPIPLGSVIGDGKHIKEAANTQEFLAAPVGMLSASEAVLTSAKVYARASKILDGRGVPAARGDEDAWAPPVSDAEAFEIMDETVSDVENELGFEIGFDLDVTASGMFKDDVYHYDDETKTTDEQIDYITRMVDEYDLVYVEDPLDESDYEDFAELTERVGDRTLICGGDLFVTNIDRLQDDVDVGAASSILIKPNQIGTLADAFGAIELAPRDGMDAVISHRPGETEDATIAHLTVATDAPFVKTDTVRDERAARLNELIRIADDTV